MSPAPDDRPGESDHLTAADGESSVSADAGEGADVAGGASGGTPPPAGVARRRTVPPPAMVLLGAILVALVANVILSWFALSSTTQLRDQYTIANGLQRCLIRAQLAENSTADPNGAAYRAAVTSCLNR